MKNSIIAVDLDETLLRSDHTISERTINVLKKCQDMGATIVISTSRDITNASTYEKKINADFVCSSAGNVIKDSKGEILFFNPFPANESIEFINTFYKYTKQIYVDSINGFYGANGDFFSSDWKLNIATKEDLLKLDVVKFFIRKNPKWNKIVEDYCIKHNYKIREVRDFDYLFISQGNTDKYDALQKLMKDLNKKTLFAFGDDFSDLVSIKNATYGVAMANSRPEILAQAKYKTDSNNDDGIANFLEKFIK